MNFLTLTLHPSIDRVIEVERLTPGALLDARLVRAVPAGKGVSTARGIRRLTPSRRRRVTAAAWLGAGEAAWIAGILAREGVAAAICARPVLTRVCVTTLERASGRETHVKEAMPAPTRAEEFALQRFCARLPLAGGCAAVCGSAPPGTRPAILRGILRALRAKARFLIADTNGPFLKTAGKAGLDGVKGNAAEIGAWLGLPHALDPACLAHRRLLQSKIENRKLKMRAAPAAVLVTLGSRGALLATPDGVWLARPPRLPKSAIRSATGCGDAANAGWMWALADGCDPAETLCRAVACGTAKLASEDPGGLDAKLARRLLHRTKARRIQ